MSRSESDVLRHVRQNHLENCFVRRIENSAGTGEPDVFFVIDGISGWYEGKFARNIPAKINTPVFGSSEHPLLTSQENWFYECCVKYRGLAWIFARIVDTYVLVPGIRCLDFNKMRLVDFDPYIIQLDMLRYHLIHPRSLGWDLVPQQSG